MSVITNYWLFLVVQRVFLLVLSLFMFLSMFIDGGVNAGWISYAPLSIINYSSIDLMFLSLHIVGLSSLLGSINFIAGVQIFSLISVIHTKNKVLEILELKY